MILDSVFEQLGQLQWVFADLLHWRQQEAIDGYVHHLLLQSAGFEKVLEAGVPHQPGQLHAGVHVVVAVLRVNPKPILLYSGTRQIKQNMSQHMKQIIIR